MILPPARKDRVVAALVLVSFAASFAFSVLPLLRTLSSGMQTIILTTVISAVAALLFPVRESEEAEHEP